LRQHLAGATGASDHGADFSRPMFPCFRLVRDPLGEKKEAAGLQLGKHWLKHQPGYTAKSIE